VALPESKLDTGLNKLGASETGMKMEGNITISGAFALYPLMVEWANAFTTIYPDINIDVSAGGAGKGMTDVISGLSDIGMISREISPDEISKGANPVAVTKDAVVAVMNADNPLASEIKANGLTKQEFLDIFISESIIDWQDVVE